MRLIIIIPCYNEEQTLPDTINTLTGVIDDMAGSNVVADDSHLLFVNDGSTDRTWHIIQQAHDADPKRVHAISLSSNYGHQNALLAGMAKCINTCDATVTIDADLQDDVNAIRRMVELYAEGNDIVYGVRDNRSSDTFFKRTTAEGYYRMLKAMGIKTIYNHADFRLMSQRAMQQLLQYGERNMVLRCVVPLLGYRHATVSYSRAPRRAGVTKYPLTKMVRLAFDGISSFSVFPIHLIFCLGVVFLVVCMAMLAWVLYVYAAGRTVPGWTTLMLSIWFCSGCLLVSFGILGEYIGKIYIEVKQRPLYNIEREL